MPEQKMFVVGGPGPGQPLVGKLRAPASGMGTALYVTGILVVFVLGVFVGLLLGLRYPLPSEAEA